MSMLKFLLFTLAAFAAGDENTPVSLPEMPLEINRTIALPWQPPDYSGQENSIGYTPTAFAVPEGMELRVQFWLNIYTKYTSDQGILHDSQYLDLVYDVVDFTDIMKREDLDANQKQKAREQRLKDQREVIKTRLLKLAETVDSTKLEGEELRLYNRFSAITDPDKFKQASEKNRLRFQLGQKDRFVLGIYHSGKYLPLMEKIFREHGMPVELTRLPFVESSFNYRARSKVGASGIWQFMRSASKRLLRIDQTVDERNDPIMATLAAARFLKTNFNMLQNWPLAVTAYNHGPSGVSRIVRRYRTNDIVELVDARHGRFQFASSNFYATFLAALEAERNAKKYFGQVYWHPPMDVEQLIFEKTFPVQKVLGWFEGDIEKAKDMNPHVSSKVWSSKQSFQPRHALWIPKDKLSVAQETLNPGQKIPQKTDNP